MNQQLEPLSVEALSVLQQAEVPMPPPRLEADILSRLRVELPTPPPISAGHSGPPASPGGSLSAAGHSLSALGRFGAPMAVASLVIGVAVGGVLHAKLAEPVVVTRIERVEVPGPVVIAPEVKAAPPVVAKRPSKPVAVAQAPKPQPPTNPDLELAQERTLIEQARSALVRGEPQLAADALATHAASFPRGRLAEERESLAIQTLVTRGDFSGARDRAARFGQTFPNSLLRPAVESALKSIPR